MFGLICLTQPASLDQWLVGSEMRTLGLDGLINLVILPPGFPFPLVVLKETSCLRGCIPQCGFQFASHIFHITVRYDNSNSSYSFLEGSIVLFSNSWIYGYAE